jgi:hypothetical protein
VEKHPQQTPPVLNYDVPEPLRTFIALPEDRLLVLGARRNPPIVSPVANTNTEVGLSTSVGFKALTSEYYAAAVRKLQPDIVVALADIPFGQDAIGTKRKDKMSDRTETWLRDMVARKRTLDAGEKAWSIFAPILPIERDLQSWYLEHLLDDMVAAWPSTTHTCSTTCPTPYSIFRACRSMRPRAHTSCCARSLWAWIFSRCPSWLMQPTLALSSTLPSRLPPKQNRRVPDLPSVWTCGTRPMPSQSHRSRTPVPAMPAPVTTAHTCSTCSPPRKCWAGY